MQKKQRLFSGENRPNDTVQSSSRKMQVALIHSTRERKRRPKDVRQAKESFSQLYYGQKVERISFSFFFPNKVGFGSKCEDKTGGRVDSRLLIQWARLELSRIDGGAPLVLRHLWVGGVWQDNKETWGRTSATCWRTATVGTLQPIGSVQGCSGALLWLTTVMSRH